jgi:hypothetical protein
MEDVSAVSRTGEVLDERYRIIEPIAAGGMGAVYRAERLGLGRFVAVKFLTDVASEQSLQRFEREARAMSRLNHPHVVSVIDFGVSKTPYIVMEYVTGRPLHDLIALGPADASRVIHIMRQLSAGLAHAHGHGIIHRDIKPANVMLTEATGTGDYVRILDFGLAKLKGAASLSSTNIVVGTPSYMAPEQSRGEEEDGRSDVYSSGILFYELLKGEKPFKGEDALQTLRMHQRDPIPPLGELRGASPELGLKIQGVVHRALAKDPTARFQSALEMSDALSELAEHAKAEAGPARGKDRGKGKSKRRKALTDVGRAKTVPLESADVAAFDEPDSAAVSVGDRAAAGDTAAGDVGVVPISETAIEAETDASGVEQAPLAEADAIPDLGLDSAPELRPAPSRFPKRRSRAGGLFMLLLLVGAAAGGYWWWDKQRAERSASGVKPVERVDAIGDDPGADAGAIGAFIELDAAAQATIDAAALTDGAPLVDGGAPGDAGELILSDAGADEILDIDAGGSGPPEEDPDEEPESESAESADAGPPPAAAVPPRPTEIRRWSDIKALLARGEQGAAVGGLRKLIRQHPRNAFYRLRLGHLYFERTAWTLGLKQYYVALKLKPSYRRYNSVNTNAIRALGAPSTRGRAHYLITRVIGRRNALPYLRREARVNKSAAVRKRAAALVKRFR